jgi:hypothetical protein
MEIREVRESNVIELLLVQRRACEPPERDALVPERARCLSPEPLSELHGGVDAGFGTRHGP